MSDEPRRGGARLGPLPIWLWLVLVAVLVILSIILGVALLAGHGGATASRPPSTATASSTPSETPSATPTPSAAVTVADPSGQGTFDSDLPNFLSDALNSQNTSVL